MRCISKPSGAGRLGGSYWTPPTGMLISSWVRRQLPLEWAGSGATSINVPAAFPKGYKAFHVMKYENLSGTIRGLPQYPARHCG
jgi:hypothetical protein